MPDQTCREVRTHEFDGHPIREFIACDGRVLYSTQDVCSSVGITKYRDKQAKLATDQRATLRAVNGRQAGRLVCLTTEAGVLMIIMRVRGEGSAQVQALREALANGAKVTLASAQDDAPTHAQPALTMPESADEEALREACDAEAGAILDGARTEDLAAPLAKLPRGLERRPAPKQAPKPATVPARSQEAVLLDVASELAARGDLERANAVKSALAELLTRQTTPAARTPPADVDVRDPRVLASVALQLAEFVQELSDSHRDLGTRVVQLENEKPKARALPMSVRTPEQPGRPTRPALPSADIGFRPLAKMLNVSEREFAAWLLENRILYRLEGKLTPTSKTRDRGLAYTTTIEVVDRGTGATCTYPKTLFTPKGVDYIMRLQDVRIVS